MTVDYDAIAFKSSRRSPLVDVKVTTAAVMAQSTHVKIDNEALLRLAKEWAAKGREGLITNDIGWENCGWHYSLDAAEAGPLTCQYVFVVDALNFCFWPTEGLEYEHLAKGLKKALEANIDALSSEHLSKVTPHTLSRWIPGFEIPQAEERCRKLRELGNCLTAYFGGLAANMVAAAHGSAATLVDLVVSLLPGFRDEAIYKGEQVFLYKRAQILVADVWAAYGQQKPGHPYGFRDISELTMFADYRVPQILAHLNILQYTPELRLAIEEKVVIAAGSEIEVEIRAASIVALEMLRAELAALGTDLLSIEADWLLWHEGEAVKDSIAPCHRTLTIFY